MGRRFLTASRRLPLTMTRLYEIHSIYIFFPYNLDHLASDILIDTPKLLLEVGNAVDDTSGVFT